jgi:hypothetical protein
MSTKYRYKSKEKNEFLTILAKNQSPITLSSCYEGMIFRKPVEVHEIYPEFAEFQVWDLSTLFPRTVHLLHCSEFPNAVKAEFIDWDFKRCLVALEGFTYLNWDWKARSRPRVQPQFPTHCTIRSKEGYFSAILSDIQIYGMGFLVKDYFIDALGIQPGAPLELNLRIHPNHYWKGLQGEILYLISTGGNYCRMGVCIHPNDDQKPFLLAYVLKREGEILRELGAMALPVMDSHYANQSSANGFTKPRDQDMER